MFRNVIFVFCKTFENSVNNKKLVIFHENCSKTFSRSLKRHNVKFLKTKMVQLILDTKTFIIIEKPPHKKTHFECCVLEKKTVIIRQKQQQTKIWCMKIYNY